MCGGGALRACADGLTGRQFMISRSSGSRNAIELPSMRSARKSWRWARRAPLPTNSSRVTAEAEGM